MHRVIYITSDADPLVEAVRAAAANRLDLTVVGSDKIPESLDGFDAALIGEDGLSAPLSDTGENGPKLVQLTRGHHLDVDAAALIASGVIVAGASTVLAPHVSRQAVSYAVAVPVGFKPRDHVIYGLGDEETPFGALGHKRAREKLSGATVGIVGLGRVGTAMAALCAELGARVIYADVRTAQHGAAARLGLRRSTLDLLLSQSDFVSLHVQWGPTSDPLLSERELRLMGPRSVLVNSADTRLVDNDVLSDFLQKERIGGAAIETNELKPAVSPFNINTVIMHRPRDTDDAVAAFVVDNIEAGLTGGALAGELEIIDFPRAGDPAFWSSKMAPRVG